jgi:Tfp pilus assembly protein PilF
MWAIKAEQSLGRYDTSTADQQIKKALADEENQLATTGHPGTSLYNIGLMESALNRKEEAKQSFERSLLLPDTHMSHHLAREALAQIAAHNE